VLALKRCLEWSARRGAALLALAILAGLLLPPLAAAFRDVITPTVVVLMTLVLLRVDPAQVLAYLHRPLLVGAMVVWILAACPLLAWLAVTALGFEGPMAAGLVVFATGCAATSSPAFARLVGLDGEVALVVSLITTLLVPFTAPPLALGLMAVDLAISIQGLMLRLALVVGLPLLISIGLRRLIGPERLREWGGAVDGASVLMVVFYGFGVMDGMLAKLLSDPGFVLGGVALAFGGCFALNAATALVFWPRGKLLALSAGLLSGNRNMALYLAVLPAATDPQLMLFFAMCQFPLFLSPFLLTPIYRRLNPSPLP
jgi:BASS family bile acid:Na+ symporter